MEIYTLILSFPYEDNEEPWSRTIEVKENFTIKQLHNYVQEIIDFDNNHLYEFYIGRNPCNRAQIIPKRAMLNEIYPITGYKLYYLFDFGDFWLFQIKKSRKKKIEEKQKKYPLLIESKGGNPEQYSGFED